jgi:ribosomal protein S18 acetylase RimI-like enzyme
VAILTSMTIEHFEMFVEASVRSHAEDNVASGRWTVGESERLARSELERLLPQGLATPDHHLYEIRAQADGPVVGYVWFGGVPRGSTTIAFVFQIFIHPAHRRLGHGRAALLQVEALASGSGYSAIALNVFGSNTGAQGLYRSLGYAVTSMSMHKPLAANRVGAQDPAPEIS